MKSRSKAKMDESQTIRSTGFSAFNSQMESESGNKHTINDSYLKTDDVDESGSFIEAGIDI